ncbi:hypothetical protein C8P64_2012 [Christiangramia gaetbulicola]|uniref:SMP-30/Gluconolactonase/LRE-like region domain-containing protein n=1 Tax=Christiangramia gaetbulicola TaxID=703340 RepID=A0A2T6AI41_9FLAO|nr:hypothetical protein [Christiangramia gaetbulicola]PTX43484.1 hypothetical protein C8P64_2012 [Christiangramia gaetbulicola]
MNTFKVVPVKLILKLFLLGLLTLFLSCSMEPEENLEEVHSKAENTKKSLKADLKILTKGAILNGANGIDVGPDGNLYVASVNRQAIFVMDKNNGKIINRFGTENGVLGPDDLVFGPDGTLYWTDILTGFVGRMTMDGQQLGYQFVAPGVNPITFSPEGRLFVALDFLGDGLYELDPQLSDPPRPIIVSTPENPFPLGFLNAFDFGPDGRLYGPLFAAGLVISVDVDADIPVSSDPFGDGIVRIEATGFQNPASAKFDSEGMLTVLDQTGEVFKINISTGEKTLFTELQPGLDNMAFDEDGSLYMTNNDEGWVAEILKSGQDRILSPGGMIAPSGLAVLSGPNNKEYVYEADLFNLRQFDGTSGKQLNIYKGFLVPEGPESLILPMNLSSDDSGNLVISSWFSGAVQVWDPQNEQVLENYLFPVPIDAVRFADDLIVSDFELGGLFWASDESKIADLSVASGLATNGESLWSADWATGTIFRIDFDGKTPLDPVIIAEDLMNPEGLALDNKGGLLVIETGAARISRIELSTGNKTILAEGLELSPPGLGLGSPPTWSFDGVAVGESGDIYISGLGATVIYRIPNNKY